MMSVAQAMQSYISGLEIRPCPRMRKETAAARALPATLAVNGMLSAATSRESSRWRNF